MKLEGNSLKMKGRLAETIQYSLRLGESECDLNPFIGKSIRFQYLNKINCVVCGRDTKKSFAQGFCYPCMVSSPENSECIIRPELCRGHLGEGRDAEWEKEHHVCEHVVYLASSSVLKVGVTRAQQVPTRFIDQGASAVRIIARTPGVHTMISAATAREVPSAVGTSVWQTTACRVAASSSRCDVISSV